LNASPIGVPIATAGVRTSASTAYIVPSESGSMSRAEIATETTPNRALATEDATNQAASRCRLPFLPALTPMPTFTPL